MQTRNLEVVVPKRREGSSPFERTIFSSGKLHFLAVRFFRERFRLLPFGKNG